MAYRGSEWFFLIVSVQKSGFFTILLKYVIVVIYMKHPACYDTVLFRHSPIYHTNTMAMWAGAENTLTLR